MKKTLVLIFAALALMIGSFIWFVATWDASVEDPVSFIRPHKPAPKDPPAAGASFIMEHRT